MDTKKLNTLIAAYTGVLEKKASMVATKIHIPNRPNISSNIRNVPSISGVSTSFAVNPRTMPIITGITIE